jgi:hypothetical protein
LGASFHILTGLWGVAMIATFIQAIRLSYQIEARSPDLTDTSGFSRNTLILHTISNRGVAADPDTQALRWRMIRLLTTNLAGFILLGLYIAWSRQ